MTEHVLDGITVVEFAGIGPAPFACGVLADLGATVVRIERPGAQDVALPGADRIGVEDRIVVELDLKDTDDRTVAQALCHATDVLVEGFRPGVMERLGFGPDDVAEGNPGVVYARITGWGQDGPMAGMAGHDINYIGLTGVLHAVGQSDPTPPLNLVGDYAAGGLYSVIGILGGLIHRTTTGEGSVIDAAMLDGSAGLLAPIRSLMQLGLWQDRRHANLLDGAAPFYRTYRTADERHMAVGALEPAFYAALVEGLELDAAELPDRSDPRTWPELAEIFADRFGTRTRDEWAAVFDGTDACVTPVLSISESGDHPHNRRRAALVEGPHGVRPSPAPRMRSIRGDDGGRNRAEPSVSDTLVALGVDEAACERLDGTGRSYRW